MALRLQRLWPGFWDNDGRCCGAAGIGTFLLRLARVLAVGPDAPVVDRPDQWWGVPARLRTVHVAP